MCNYIGRNWTNSQDALINLRSLEGIPSKQDGLTIKIAKWIISKSVREVSDGLFAVRQVTAV